MDGLIGPGVVPFGQGDVAPMTGAVGEATNGSLSPPVPRTRLPAWWITLVIRELRAVVVDGGLTPNARVFTQVRDAIRAMIAKSVRTPRQATFISTGSWTAPAGVTRVRARVVGGGGAGGGCLQGAGGHSGGGGGAGGYAEGWCAVAPGQAYAITIAAIANPNTNTTGGNGGTCSFGTFLICGGGEGGAAGNPDSHGGAGGLGVVGAGCEGFGTPGGSGSDGDGANSAAKAGDGGASAFGGGGRAGTAGGVSGRAAGSGGGGAYNTTGLAGAGSAGLVILEWWE